VAADAGPGDRAADRWDEAIDRVESLTRSGAAVTAIGGGAQRVAIAGGLAEQHPALE